MNWDHFRNPKTGKFRVKRLPAIRSPIPVKDVTEVSDYIDCYDHMPFDHAVQEYQNSFDAYEIEVGELDMVFDSAPAKYLGNLSAVRRDSSLFWSLLDIEDLSDDSQAVKTSPAIAEKLTGLVRIIEPADPDAVRILLDRYRVAELKEICSSLGLTVGGKKGDLIQRLVEHEDANPGTVPMPTMVMPLPALKQQYRECYTGMIETLIKQLASYPDRYRRLVYEELVLSFDDEHFDTREIIVRKSGIDLPPPVPVVRKTKEEGQAESRARLAAHKQHKKASRTAEAGWPTSYKVAAVVVAVLVIWALI